MMSVTSLLPLDITSTNNGGVVSFDSTKIYEGTYVTAKYLVDTSDIEQRYILGDSRADTSTLSVKVQNSGPNLTQPPQHTLKVISDITQLSSTKTSLLFTRG